MLRASRAFAVVVPLLACSPSAVSAQELVGRLVSLRTGRPVADALVVLVDADGVERRRLGTLAAGRFAFRLPQAGSYTIRVLRIGYEPWESEAQRVSEGQSLETDFIVPDERLVLPEIVVTGRRACDADRGGGGAAAFLMEEARKAFALAEETLKGGRLRFRTSTYLQELDRTLVLSRELSRTAGAMRDWPIESAPVDSLARWGFVKSPTESEASIGFGPKYFGPDGTVLFSSWFLGAHCFEIVPGKDDTVTVGLRFRVAKGVTRPDIEGTLWVDSTSLELRRLDYHYVNLDGWVPSERTGGFLEFGQLPAGGWVVRRWSLRAPIPQRDGLRMQLAGYLESGGEVVEVLDAEGHRVF